MNNKNKKYFSSKEMMKELKVSSCQLMHLRTKGELEFIKKGSSYLYRKKKNIK
jgi:hypothetical protein